MLTRFLLYGFLISWDYLPIWFIFGFMLEYLHDRFVAITPHIVAIFSF
ncbi:MAG: hypothetical protein MOB07_15165 [Acidobacteria bacterium]|nr:hypothetical protein [Acidobacteriota bacterium]